VRVCAERERACVYVVKESERKRENERNGKNERARDREREREQVSERVERRDKERERERDRERKREKRSEKERENALARERERGIEKERVRASARERVRQRECVYVFVCSAPDTSTTQDLNVASKRAGACGESKGASVLEWERSEDTRGSKWQGRRGGGLPRYISIHSCTQRNIYIHT